MTAFLGALPLIYSRPEKVGQLATAPICVPPRASREANRAAEVVCLECGGAGIAHC